MSQSEQSDSIASTQDTSEVEQIPEMPTQPISAAAGKYFRNMRYLFVAAMLFMGGYFAYDGWIGYPAKNAKFDDLTAKMSAADAEGNEALKASLSAELKLMGEKHQQKDINIQIALGFLLPPMAIGMLIYWLRISRGTVELKEDTLHAPGHPPVPLANVIGLDDGLWDRKGISYAEYQLADGTKGKIKLDDFVYDRMPIDDIHLLVRESVKSKATS